jgi:NRAMP (natural resistance-associated macrophage protein)-like metal ion transporter
MTDTAESPRAPDQPPRPRTRTEVAAHEAKSYFRNLGPGLITGAADDDPSGIATYSQAGAAFGFGFLWATFLTLPLMAAVQLMCARVGIVARSGLASVLRKHYPVWVLWMACMLLLVGNVINIAADLGGMAAAVHLLTGLPSVWFVPVFTGVILALLIYASYEIMTRVLKWLSIVLFAYVVSGFLAKPDWWEVLRGTVIPQITFSHEYLLTLVAILGTTISPYLFFWQAAQNAEQEAHLARALRGKPRRALQRELRVARRDVNAGMFVSNAIMYFIILTTGATLHQAGQTDIQSAAQAAEALRPVAGDAAALLFTVGIIGTGMLAIPVLAGSAAYAIAEAAAWRSGMDETPHSAKHFYGVIAVAMVGGMLLALMDANAIKLLFGAAVINGLLAPPLIIIILLVCNNRDVMKRYRNGKALNILGGLAALLMTGSAVALLWSWL